MLETRESCFEKSIAKRTSADSISITDGWIEDALDRFRKGRALPTSSPDTLNPTVDISMAAMKAFNVARGVEQKRRDVKTLVQLKGSGDLLAYNTKLALGHGEDLLHLFGEGTGIKNSAKYVKSDALAAEIEKTLVTQRELYAAANTKEPKPNYNYGHESTASNLVKKYNRAVESANGMD